MEKEDARSCGGTVPVTVAHVERVQADAPHSPLPWCQRVGFPAVIIDRQYGKVADCGMQEGVSEPDAEFIVRAVNSHDELLAVLKAIEEIGEIDGHGHRYRGFDYFSPLGKQLRAAIKKAEGKP